MTSLVVLHKEKHNDRTYDIGHSIRSVCLLPVGWWLSLCLEHVAGIEPASLAWKARIMTII